MTFPSRYGPYGGRYVPETLMAPLVEVERAFEEARAEAAFGAELEALVRDYAGRPTPLYHARKLSQRTGREIWLKREDLLHGGAHKTNNTLGQGLLARRLGKSRIIAETGAGQHGVATAMTGAMLGIPVEVYMGSVDVERQRPNVQRMELFGAAVGWRDTPVVGAATQLRDRCPLRALVYRHVGGKIFGHSCCRHLPACHRRLCRYRGCSGGADGGRGMRLNGKPGGPRRKRARQPRRWCPLMARAR